MALLHPGSVAPGAKTTVIGARKSILEKMAACVFPLPGGCTIRKTSASLLAGYRWSKTTVVYAAMVALLHVLMLRLWIQIDNILGQNANVLNGSHIFGDRAQLLQQNHCVANHSFCLLIHTSVRPKAIVKTLEVATGRLTQQTAIGQNNAARNTPLTQATAFSLQALQL